MWYWYFNVGHLIWYFVEFRGNFGEILPAIFHSVFLRKKYPSQNRQLYNSRKQDSGGSRRSLTSFFIRKVNWNQSNFEQVGGNRSCRKIWISTVTSAHEKLPLCSRVLCSINELAKTAVSILQLKNFKNDQNWKFQQILELFPQKIFKIYFFCNTDYHGQKEPRVSSFPFFAW